MTQQEASEMLGVRAQTLYAYVSRGLIEVRRDPTLSRSNLYRADDILALLRKRDLGRAPKNIAASTMAWGEPIISTCISTVVHGRLFYRGHDAVQLAATLTLEEVAKLLWNAEDQPCFPVFVPDTEHHLVRARAYSALGEAAAVSPPAHALSMPHMCREAADLVGRLASNFIDLDPRPAPLHMRIARGWNCEDRAELLRRVLVLVADQELTTSAFAARVTASTGASLGACAIAGLAAVSGPFHGDATVLVQALLVEVQRSGAERAVNLWMSSGRPLPGFGHQLYPEGDPRAADLLAAFPPSDGTSALIECVQRLTGLQPNIDVALAALAEHCGLPEGAAFSLFAIGRSVGWMAHSIEQISTGHLIRPRARYVGVPIMASEEK